MELERIRFLVVEGPIGAGKTSLAKRLADHFGAQALLEEPENNPFLARFYEDMARYALPTQLNFLFQRADQLQPLTQLDLFQRMTVADYLLDKDPLFARMNLSDDEYRLYDKIYGHLRPLIPPPDLVIYLQAPVAQLADRVSRRGVLYERNMAEAYLARLNEAYARFFHSYSDAPVLTVNNAHLNVVAKPEHFELLLRRITEMRGGREFFSLGDA